MSTFPGTQIRKIFLKFEVLLQSKNIENRYFMIYIVVNNTLK